MDGFPQWTYRIGACGSKYDDMGRSKYENFTTPNGLLTSPSYPHNYPADNDNCYYYISQPNDTSLYLKILSMDIFTTNYEYSRETPKYNGIFCDFGYLQVRDGPSRKSPIINGYCGDSTDLPLPIEIQSTQNNVQMM